MSEILKVIKKIKLRAIICACIGSVSAIGSSMTWANVWSSLLTSKTIKFQIQKQTKENIYLFNFADHEHFDCFIQFNPFEVELESIKKALPIEDFMNLQVENNRFSFHTTSASKHYQAQQIKLELRNKTENISEALLQCKVGNTPFEVIDKRVVVINASKAKETSKAHASTNRKLAEPHLSNGKHEKSTSGRRPLPSLPITSSRQSKANSKTSLLELLREFEQGLTSPSASLLEQRNRLVTLNALLPIFESIKSKGEVLEKMCQDLERLNGTSTSNHSLVLTTKEKEPLKDETLKVLCHNNGFHHSIQPSSSSYGSAHVLEPTLTVLPSSRAGSSAPAKVKESKEHTAHVKSRESHNNRAESSTMQGLHDMESQGDIRRAEELLKDPRRKGLLAQLKRVDGVETTTTSSSSSSLSQRIDQREKERKELEAKRKLEQEEIARKELKEAQEVARSKLQPMHTELLSKLKAIGTTESPIKVSRPPEARAEERIQALKKLRNSVSSGEVKSSDIVADAARRQRLSRQISSLDAEEIIEAFSNKNAKDEFRDAVALMPNMMDSFIIEDTVRNQEGASSKKSKQDNTK